MKTAILLALWSHVFADTCWLDNAKVTSPFVISDDFTVPSVDVDKRIHYNEGDSFYVKCRPGLTNSLISDEGDVVICMTKTLILNARTTQTLDFATLFCKPKAPLGAVRRRNATCANDFSLYDIGVSIDETVFAPLVTVCFDEDKLSPFYAETLQPYRRDSSSGGLASLDAYPFFQDAGGVYGTNLDLLYFDSEAVMSGLGVDGYPLRPLPLLRTEIFVDPLYQRLELDYIASFPANRSLRAVQPWSPDWLVGTLGVATGTNDKGETVELYLNDGTVPVPSMGARRCWMGSSI